jgi:hypothetical protein
MDESLIEIKHQKLLLALWIRKQLHLGSGSNTVFFLRYASDGPFSEHTEYSNP